MAESFIEDPETDEAKRPSPLTSLMVNLRTETLLSGGSLMRENDGCSARLTGHQIYIILPLTMIRFLSSGVKNGELHDLKTKVFKAMNELTPGVNCDLVLQHLSEVDTDYLVECVLEIARICRQLEEENENYRQRKEVFANLYEKERGQVVKYKIELEQQKKSAGKLEENLKWEVDQKIQQALEIGKLHAECTSLRTVLQHSTEEWNREKQNLLQIKNERLQQAEMQERNEKTITGELQKLRDELQVARLDKEQVTKEFEMRISDLLVEQTQKEQEILKLKNQLAATDAANIITLRKENNNLRNAVRYLEKTKVEKDNENAAVLLQLREYQRKYGAFGSTYAYDYPVGQGVTVADGGKRTSVPSDKQ